MTNHARVYSDAVVPSPRCQGKSSGSYAELIASFSSFGFTRATCALRDYTFTPVRAGAALVVYPGGHASAGQYNRAVAILRPRHHILAKAAAAAELLCSFALYMSALS
jgi:hypothetical protein